MGRTGIHHDPLPRSSYAQCRRYSRHYTRNPTSRTMNYTGVNLSDVRNVFNDPRQKPGSKTDSFPPSINSRTQTIGDPRLQPLQNVASWQGGEPQPARVAWNHTNPTYEPFCLDTEPGYQGLLHTDHTMMPLSRSNQPSTQLSKLFQADLESRAMLTATTSIQALTQTLVPPRDPYKCVS